MCTLKRTFPKDIYDIYKRNGDDFHGKKPMSLKKATRLFTKEWLYRKYPHLASEFDKPSSSSPSETIADDLIYDRIHWAIQDKGYIVP